MLCPESVTLMHSLRQPVARLKLKRLKKDVKGKCYATSEYAQHLADAGFVDVTHADTVADRGVMTARRPI